MPTSEKSAPSYEVRLANDMADFFGNPDAVNNSVLMLTADVVVRSMLTSPTQTLKDLPKGDVQVVTTVWPTMKGPEPEGDDWFSQSLRLSNDTQQHWLNFPIQLDRRTVINRLARNKPFLDRQYGVELMLEVEKDKIRIIMNHRLTQRSIWMNILV